MCLKILCSCYVLHKCNLMSTLCSDLEDHKHIVLLLASSPGKSREPDHIENVPPLPLMYKVVRLSTLLLVQYSD